MRPAKKNDSTQTGHERKQTGPYITTMKTVRVCDTGCAVRVCGSGCAVRDVRYGCAVRDVQYGMCGTGCAVRGNSRFAMAARHEHTPISIHTLVPLCPDRQKVPIYMPLAPRNSIWHVDFQTRMPFGMLRI